MARRRRSVAHLVKYQFKKRGRASAKSAAGSAGSMAKGIVKGAVVVTVASMLPGVFGLSGALKTAIYTGIAWLVGLARSWTSKGLLVAGALLGASVLGGFLAGNGMTASGGWQSAGMSW